MDVADLRAKIREIKDFPTEGILFKDITTLLKDGPAFRRVVDLLSERYRRERVEVVVGVESRGFILGGALAVHEDAIVTGQRVLAVDDLLATGGTMAATLRLVEQLGGRVVGVAFMIELAFLHGRDKLKNYPLHSLIVYD